MFKLQPVEDCPHTRKSCGIVRMSPELISQLAAAVYDEDEWAIVLTGERHENGYVIDVLDYFIPPQERSSGNVVVKDVDIDHSTGCLPDGRRVVGVIHSHHSMRAFFSHTDITTLNTRFPMSIVIAQNSRTYLGFEYKGVGKVVLPCGATGEIKFEIQPTVGPVIAEVSRVVDHESFLGDCSRVSSVQPDQFHIQDVTACGLETAVSRVAGAFGKGNELFEVVKQLPRPAPIVVEKPKQAKENLLQSLFKQLSSPTISSPKEDDNNGYTEVFCEACKQYDDFWEWECKCGEGEYCMDCNIGHDVKFGCPKEVRVETGV